MLSLALEERVLLDFDQYVGVARRAAVGARFALARQTQPHFVVDARGNVHLALHALGHHTLPAALWARVFDHLAFAVAHGASGLHAENARRLNDLASTAAVVAGLRLGAGRAPTAAAIAALLVPLELDDLGYAAGRFEQVERDRGTNIGAPSRPTAAPIAAEEIAENAVAKDVAEGREDVVDVGEVRGRAADARMTKAIVAGPLIGVAEDLEGLGRFLEVGDRFFVAGVLVRMVLDRQLAISVGDFLCRRVRATPRTS